MNGMSTPEFLGIFIAAASSVASVLFMMIGYTAAIHSRIRLMLVYLRIAGCLSLASWMVMAAVMFRCDQICWIAKKEHEFQPIIPAFKIADAPSAKVKTPGGSTIEWSSEHAELRRPVGSGGFGRDGSRFISGGG